MSFDNKNYLDKFFSQLSKVGKYVPVKSKKVFGHVLTNPGTEPFYNYIRSILKVTSKKLNEIVLSKDDPIFVEIVGVIY